MNHETPVYPQNLAVTPPTGGARSVGIVRRPKGGKIQRDTNWRLQVPVAVIKRCETSGEFHKSLECFTFSFPQNNLRIILNFSMRRYSSEE
jgi:hypothetical protein